MKKSLLFCVLALSLSSCDLFNGFTPKKKDQDWHHGISLRMWCNDGLQISAHQDQVYMYNLDMSSIMVGTTTIKRQNNKITFYDYPVKGKGHLEELPKDTNPDGRYFEMDVDFTHSSNKDLDFVYFTNISWNVGNDPNFTSYSLRLAIFDKETSTDYFVFSGESKGQETKTSYNLDLDADGELDTDQDGLIEYTTGLPYYYTDSYELSIPKPKDIDEDNIDPLLAAMKVYKNKPITVRMWLEGWEVNGNTIPEFDVNIRLDFSGHFAK